MMSEKELRAVTGTIFNLQHFCIHDGPGIRTNVFVKGCPLRCIWCANPESQKRNPQLMVQKDRCAGCGSCVEHCQKHAISLLKQIYVNQVSIKAFTDRTLCINCGVCTSFCKQKVREIAGHIITAGEVFDEVMEDVLFYDEDGGITVTGGEALAQPLFTAALLELSKRAGIRTAIETCGFAEWNTIVPVLERTDVVLYDIKEMDPVRHKEYTGVDPGLIHENLQKINDQMSCEIWVRVPVIPGFNDREENIHAIGLFVSKKITRCSQVHLLPFHKLGMGKKEELEEYQEAFSSEVPDEPTMEKLRDIIRSYGIQCK